MDKHYHFIGIGGIGMGALARLVLAKGGSVSGSDICPNRITGELEEQGVRISCEHDPQNIEGADCIVFSSAINENNPELKAALRKGMPVLQRAELLAELMQNYRGITVAGAHGKTTTTSMVSHLLIAAGLNPTTAVGGVINGTDSNAQLGTGDYFVAEVDESDGSFLYFSPHYSIITNIDFEHVDYYRNWDNILNAYREFILRTEETGMIFAYGGDERLLKLLKESKAKFRTYGFAGHNDILAKNIRADNFFISYDCFRKRKLLGRVELKVPGRHNILNSLACVALGLECSIPFEAVASHLKEYLGVKRRFQLIDHIDGVYVVDDYAHHPTEIKSTLEAAAAIDKKRLVAVFQPHRYSRVKSLAKEFVQSLQAVDYLVVTDIYAASEKPVEGAEIGLLVEQLTAARKNPTVYLEMKDILTHLSEMVKPGDLILTMGAGDVTRAAHEFAESFRRVHRTSFEAAGKDVL